MGGWIGVLGEGGGEIAELVREGVDRNAGPQQGLQLMFGLVEPSVSRQGVQAVDSLLESRVLARFAANP